MNTEQRKQLESLSRKITGNPNTWQEYASLRLQIGVKEVREETMVTIRGTRMALGKAIMRALHSGVDAAGNPIPHFQIVSKPVYGSPTFEQLHNLLLGAWQMVSLSKLSDTAKLALTGNRFARGTLLNIPWLVVGANDKNDVADLLALLPTELAQKLGDRYVPNGNPKEFCLDASQFLNEVIFSLNSPEEANRIADALERGEAVPLNVA